MIALAKMTDRNRWWSFSWNWGSATKNAQAQPRHYTIHSNQSSRNEALKNFNKSTYLLQPHHLLLHISLPLICCTWWERSSSPVNFSSKNATCVRWIVLKINFIFFFICFLFFLNPQNLNDHHHQHSQTPNYLPIVWCLTNNLLTSWSLILLNLNSSKKITSINVLPHHLNQSAPSKFNFFFYLTNQFDNKIPHLIHQTPINLQIQI